MVFWWTNPDVSVGDSNPELSDALPKPTSNIMSLDVGSPTPVSDSRDVGAELAYE